MKLPESLLITTPHSSYYFPGELSKSVALNPCERREGCDLGTKELALLAAEGNENLVHSATYSRLAVDLNRTGGIHYDIGPLDASENGVSRLKDFYGRGIYIKGNVPDEHEKQALIEKYHRPWVEELRERLKKRVRLVIDLHNTPDDMPIKTTFLNNKPVKQKNISDFEISSRSAYADPKMPFTQNEILTFPPDEVEAATEIINKHLGDFWEEVLNKDRGELRVTWSEMWAGGTDIKRERDWGNWQGGTPRVLQLEPLKSLMTDTENVEKDNKKIEGLARAFNRIIDEIMTNTLPQ
jgi:hypothetical protein